MPMRSPAASPAKAGGRAWKRWLRMPLGSDDRLDILGQRRILRCLNPHRAMVSVNCRIANATPASLLRRIPGPGGCSRELSGPA